ncbi:hypothetical protein G6F57_005154 [Rhizopus arrhizus]|uniref:SMAD/FHA domain-containing protein n=1 Tax=Rhizopus oryzae TaxID=64495 RepID=A0A9P6XBS5_RHIOR|nr:hypothetical protein G6F23_003718 [Rhizopus arrhizus]KAG1417589.1 hypothetical protein G6F58_005449 [Rhizopus delemar]KAG0765051.1 hypothetical protein G6F24_004725 [Rhizopus arrhizus]KAG0790774.1 hypothetical protein G6F21_005559 [Rhizopus arrhizus]KAG0802308.1 hypothetical protein G6F22_000392 [Rhizopus arrhizus]
MPRNRSLSASNTSSSPALISRGFASIRRAHRRLSTSSPITPPLTNQESTYDQPQESESHSVNKPRIRLVPNVGLSSRSFVFDIIDRELEPGVMYRIGRFSDRNSIEQRLSFKSKVVSRNHAELWTEQGKVFIRDIGSSSGTFVNRLRLSPPNHESQQQEVKDGDIVQLGVDYQGGIESIYRAVRIRVEINRTEPQPTPFTRAAFQQLRSQLISTPAAAAADTFNNDISRELTRTHDNTSDESPQPADIQECCICLYAIAPFQALFVAPCSHVFHFKCLRPIVFQNYPGFSCPLCRNYFDLEASVAVEVEDVLEVMNQNKKEPTAAIDTVAEEEEDQQQQQQQQQQESSMQSTDETPGQVSVPKETPRTVSEITTTASTRQGETFLATTLVSPALLDDVMATSNSTSSTQ